jgi:pimeloyl-ACP methyl ester carboxylesterase
MTATFTPGEQLLKINGVELCVETFGDRADPAILLVAGSSASMLWWEAELCQRIAAGGRYVIRYDHRDTGRSISYPPGEPGYTYNDLVLDVLGIQDALGVERSHLVCQSMFGGIGLVVGVDHPERVASLTFLSTSTGDAGLPGPTAVFPAEPDPADSAAVVAYVVASVRACAGSHFDEAAIQTLVERDVARAKNYESTLVNHYAIDSPQPTGGGFGDIAAPTLVLHGDHDPLVPLPHGQALRDAIPGAELVVLEGAGHDVPRPVWDVFVSALIRHTGGGRS